MPKSELRRALLSTAAVTRTNVGGLPDVAVHFRLVAAKRYESAALEVARAEHALERAAEYARDPGGEGLPSEGLR